jgi:hypothetical protein
MAGIPPRPQAPPSCSTKCWECAGNVCINRLLFTVLVSHTHTTATAAALRWAVSVGSWPRKPPNAIFHEQLPHTHTHTALPALCLCGAYDSAMSPSSPQQRFKYLIFENFLLIPTVSLCSLMAMTFASYSKRGQQARGCGFESRHGYTVQELLFFYFVPTPHLLSFFLYSEPIKGHACWLGRYTRLVSTSETRSITN